MKKEHHVISCFQFIKWAKYLHNFDVSREVTAPSNSFYCISWSSPGHSMMNVERYCPMCSWTHGILVPVEGGNNFFDGVVHYILQL